MFNEALIMLLFANIYWAFGMQLAKYSESSMRGRVERQMRGALVDIIRILLMAVILIGTLAWFFRSYRWYYAIVAFVLRQIIGGLISSIPIMILMKFKSHDLSWIGVS